MRGLSISIAMFMMLGCPIMCQAHTEAEEDAFVDVLVEVHQADPINSDCISEKESEDIDPNLTFSTIDQLFACPIWNNRTGSGWSPDERRVAFEHYMSRLATKDRRQMSRSEMSTALFAFVICEHFGYTNCLSAARAVILSEYAPRQDQAIDFFFNFVEPSVEATDTAVFMATNTATFSRSDRYYALKAYCQKVAQLPPTSSVFTDALERLNASRTAHTLYRPLDNLFIARDPTYETSSNRYELAMEALRYAKPNTPNERYFQSITNRLGRTLVP